MIILLGILIVLLIVSLMLYFIDKRREDKIYKEWLKKQ